MSSIENPIVPSESGRPGVPDVRSERRLPIDRGELGQAFGDCLRTVETALRSKADEADIERARIALEDLAHMVRAEGTAPTPRDYEPFLQRLTQQYTNGCEQRENTACMGTATAYAGLVEAVSRAYPRFDFTNAFGQLLELMTRLFSARNNNWKIVYEHLRAVPDSVVAKQNLTRVCAAGIREWFDAGVQNLFSLRSGLTEKIRELEQHADEIADEIRAKKRTLTEARRQIDPRGTGKIVALQEKFLEREIIALQGDRDAVLDELEGRKGTRALIESDIQEFEGILRDARRAYYIHVV